MQAYLFFGPPGAGKGTQREMLEQYFTEKSFDWKSLQVGSLLREYITTNLTAFKERVKKVMNDGGLVPSALPIALLLQYVSEQKDLSEHLIIDGAGRKLVETQILTELLLFFPGMSIYTFLLDVPKQEVFDRLKKRGRHDDTEQTIENRFVYYNDTVSGTMASINFLRNHPEVVMHEINGVGTVEEVHQRVLSHVS